MTYNSKLENIKKKMYIYKFYISLLYIKVMSQYFYYSKVLAQLSAIFYCAGCPRDSCINDIMWHSYRT